VKFSNPEFLAFFAKFKLQRTNGNRNPFLIYGADNYRQENQRPMLKLLKGQPFDERKTCDFEMLLPWNRGSKCRTTTLRMVTMRRLVKKVSFRLPY